MYITICDNKADVDDDEVSVIISVVLVPVRGREGGGGGMTPADQSRCGDCQTDHL